MTIAALLCGLFYGALFHAAYRKAQRTHYLSHWLNDGLSRLVTDIKRADWTLENAESRKRAKHLAEILRKHDRTSEYDCVCDECCDCESDPDGVGVWMQGENTAWPNRHETLYYEGPLPSEHGACDCYKRPFPGDAGPSVSVGT
jgi:hypothetical protein